MAWTTATIRDVDAVHGGLARVIVRYTGNAMEASLDIDEGVIASTKDLERAARTRLAILNASQALITALVKGRAIDVSVSPTPDPVPVPDPSPDQLDRQAFVEAHIAYRQLVLAAELGLVGDEVALAALDVLKAAYKPGYESLLPVVV